MALFDREASARHPHRHWVHGLGIFSCHHSQDRGADHLLATEAQGGYRGDAPWVCQPIPRQSANLRSSALTGISPSPSAIWRPVSPTTSGGATISWGTPNAHCARTHNLRLTTCLSGCSASSLRELFSGRHSLPRLFRVSAGSTGPIPLLAQYGVRQGRISRVPMTDTDFAKRRTFAQDRPRRSLLSPDTECADVRLQLAVAWT